VGDLGVGGNVSVCRMTMTKRSSTTTRPHSSLHPTLFCRSSALVRCTYFAETTKTLVYTPVCLSVCVSMSVCLSVCLSLCMSLLQRCC